MAADKEIDMKWNDIFTLKVEHKNNTSLVNNIVSLDS